MKTRLEVFRVAANGMLNQNARSEDGHVCRYRGPHSKKCPVGFLIPDNLYLEEWNYMALNVSDLFSDYPEVMEKCGLIRSRHEAILVELQYIHDFMDCETWADKIAFAAKEFSIDFVAEHGA